MNRLFADHALLPEGFATRVLLSWDDGGRLSGVQTGVECPADAARATGLVVPGLPNLHSHAFQRAFAGLTEYRASAHDSFWSWRDLMYRFAGAISPDELEAIATQLYVEMLRAGYTSVCEFHYVHHHPDGRPYANPAEMSLRLVAAAHRAGIGLTILPVLYQTSGFGAKPPRDDQKRFLNDVDALLCVVEALRGQGVRTGVAPHSLRAVPPAALADLLAGLHAIDPTARCTSTSPSRSRRCATASPPAVRGRCNGCSTTRRSMSAGAWCMPPTSTTPNATARRDAAQ